MAAVTKINSNATGLRISEETSFKVADGAAVWTALPPNSYADFGGETVLFRSAPINDGRQLQKSVVVDVNAAGGFEMDMPTEGFDERLQGQFFASLRRKGEEVPTAATGTTDLFSVASTTGFQVNDICRSTGWAEAGNNFDTGLVTAVVADTTVEFLGETLVTQASPPAGVNLVVVGHRAGSADLDVDVASTFPALTSTTLDFTTLGLNVGETVFVGGDTGTLRFTNTENNGPKRVRTIAANRLEFDKSDSAMVTETGTGKTVELYTGRVLKNELAANQVRRTYQVERTLGAPDDASPANIQAEYLVGAIPGTATMKMPSASVVRWDLGYTAGDHETIDGPTSLKAGTRPALTDTDKFNTSSDFSRIRLATHTDGTEAPTPLFSFATEMNITFDNNLDPAKALGTVGAFEISEGNFQVGGTITAYFSSTTAVAAIKAGTDVTVDIFMVKNNKGFAIDLPLIALGDGKANVEIDQLITLPLSMDASTASSIDANLNHTALMTFFDYLPNLADT